MSNEGSPGCRASGSNSNDNASNRGNDDTPPTPSTPRVGSGMEQTSLVSLLLGTPPTPSEPSPSNVERNTRPTTALTAEERRRLVSDALTSALAISEELSLELEGDGGSGSGGGDGAEHGSSEDDPNDPTRQ